MVPKALQQADTHTSAALASPPDLPIATPIQEQRQRLPGHTGLASLTPRTDAQKQRLRVTGVREGRRGDGLEGVWWRK